MYHKLEKLYADMDDRAERELLEQKGRAAIKDIQKARRKARRLSNKYKVGGNGFRARSFIHRAKAVKYYLDLKKKEAQPYIISIEAGVMVRTSLARLDLKIEKVVSASTVEETTPFVPDLKFFRGLPEGDAMPILLPKDRIRDEKEARAPSILTKPKRILPVVPEHHKMMGGYLMGIALLGLSSYWSVAYNLGG